MSIPSSKFTVQSSTFGVLIKERTNHRVHSTEHAIHPGSSVNFIVTPDIEQDNFFFGDHKGEGDSIPVGKADRLAPF